MKTALIGHTGFVGSNILRQAKFDYLYNSENINDIQGMEFDLVVCAGVPAVKWWANKEPEKDFAIIQQLLQIYQSITAKTFVLISTVDVYPSPLGVDEDTEIDIQQAQYYGKHRLQLENALKESFDNLHVLRLPGLFGKGIKKNILFDLLCDNMVDKINLDSEFQWYPLSRIWKDIRTAIDNDISLVNMAVEPIKSRDIQELFFAGKNIGSNAATAVRYDMRTLHSKIYSSSKSNYILSAKEVLTELSIWLRNPEVNRG